MACKGGKVLLSAGPQVPLSDMTALQNNKRVLKQEVTEFMQVQGVAPDAYTKASCGPSIRSEWRCLIQAAGHLIQHQEQVKLFPTTTPPKKTTPTTRKLTRIMHFRRLARDTYFLNLTLTLSILPPTCTFDFHLLAT